MNAVANIAHRLHEEEVKLLAQLRDERREAKTKPARENSLGDRVEIELLHQKLDLLRETEVSELIQVIRRLEARLPPGEIAAIQAAETPTRG